MEGIEDRAKAQEGVIARRQALEMGMTTRQIDGRVKAGRWTPLYRGVYRLEGARSTHLQALHAAVLAAGEGAVASDRSAAWLWDFVDDLELEVTIPPGRSFSNWEIGVKRRSLRRDEICPRRGVMTTNPLRTILDLACVGDGDLLEQVLDRGIATKLVSPAALEATLAREAKQGRVGVRMLRGALARRHVERGMPPSVLESALRRITRKVRGFGEPRFEYRILDGQYRIDVAWPAQRVGIEVDGYSFHAGWDEFRLDRQRQNELVLLRWTILRFTWPDVRYHPDVVARQIEAALAAAVSA